LSQSRPDRTLLCIVSGRQQTKNFLKRGRIREGQLLNGTNQYRASTGILPKQLPRIGKEHTNGKSLRLLGFGRASSPCKYNNCRKGCAEKQSGYSFNAVHS